MAASFLLSAFALPATATAALKRIEVQGHRGARARFPENTIPAFEYALKIGVDVLELDLGVTKDDVIVINHDSEINPEHCLFDDGTKLEKPVAIRSLTLAEVKKFDCGTLKHPKFPKQTPVPGTKLSTLDEFFEFLAHSDLPAAKTVEFNIETKISPERPDLAPAPEVFAKLFLDAIKRHGVFNRVVMQSFDYRTLAEARKLDRKIRISLLDQNPAADQVALVKEYKANVLSPRQDLARPDSIARLHKMKVQVIPWTANTPAEWDALIIKNVDGIISDDPEALIEHLKSKGLR